MLALLLRLLGGGDILLRFFRRKAHLLDDRVSPGLDPATIVGRGLLEVREDGFARDDARHRVGHERPRAVSSRDPHVPLVGRNEQQDAVVAFFVTDLPRATKPVGVIFDRIAFEAVDGRNDELPAALRLERLRLAR